MEAINMKISAVANPPPHSPMLSFNAEETKTKQTPAGPEPKKDTKPAQSEFVRKVANGNEEAIRKVAESINRFMEDMDFSLRFIPDKEAGIVIVKVLDSDGNIIRTIPPEELAALTSRIGSSIGMLVNVNR
ncbi:MAG: flagellar protein FlaG [Deltaproteobacteria bacterium]|nr:flagellar protein FlaG [Deltaproteobacteria bacterium]